MPAKAPELIDVGVPLNVTVVSPEQLPNAPLAILVRLAGNSKEVKLEHIRKALSPIVSIAGKLIDVRLVQ